MRKGLNAMGFTTSVGPKGKTKVTGSKSKAGAVKKSSGTAADKLMKSQKIRMPKGY